MCWSCVRDQGRIKILTCYTKHKEFLTGLVNFLIVYISERGKKSHNYNYNLHLYFENQNIENF